MGKSLVQLLQEKERKKNKSSAKPSNDSSGSGKQKGAGDGSSSKARGKGKPKGGREGSVVDKQQMEASTSKVNPVLKRPAASKRPASINNPSSGNEDSDDEMGSPGDDENDDSELQVLQLQLWMIWHCNFLVSHKAFISLGS